MLPLVALALLAQAPPILAGPPGAEVLLEADTITYGWEREVLELKGHVVVRRGDGIVRAASARYDRAHGTVLLEGGVLGVQGRQVFLADRAQVDLEAKTADLASAVLLLKEARANPDNPRAGRNTLTMRGSHVRQIADGTYEASDVMLTPCDCAGSPDYDLRASSATISGDRAALSGVHLDLFGAPLPLFPLSLPLTSRQSGLLAPQLGYTGQVGFAYAQPVFLTLGPSADTTLTPGIFTGTKRTRNPALGARSVRGPRLDLELRYAPIEGTTGSIGADLFYDLFESDSPGAPGIARGRGFHGLRGVVRAAHRTQGSDATFALDGAWAGDTMILSDTLPPGIDRSADVLRTDAGLWRARGPLTLGLEASLLEDLRIEDFGLPDRRLLFSREARSTFQRLPAAFAQLAPVPAFFGTFSAEASVAQFVSPTGYDAREQQTGFGPTDLQTIAPPSGWPDPGRRPALRLDAAPRLTFEAPRALPFDLRLELWGRGDAWMIEGAPDLQRSRLYGVADLRAGLPLERAFGTRLHRIEPSVEVRAISRPFRTGAQPIGDPADAGGPAWLAAPDAAEQGFARGLAAAGGSIEGVPASRRPYDEIDGAAPSTGAVQTTFALSQGLWERAGRTARPLLRLDLAQDVLLWTDEAGARVGETSASLSVQQGPGGGSALVRYDWRTRAVTAVTGGVSLHDGRSDEVHATATLLRAGTASERVRAGIDELFATVAPAALAGALSGALWTGLSGPIPIGGPNLRLAYDTGWNLGFVLPNAPSWTHRLSASIETPCRCAGVSLSVEAPLRDGKLLNGPVVHFLLDLKSLGSFATF